MNKDSPSATSAASPARLGQGLAWIGCGLERVRRRLPLWLGMSAIYLLLGFVLKLIPFMGDLLLVLISPLLLASIVWGFAEGSPVERPPRKTSTTQALLQSWVEQPAQELLRIFSREDKLIAAVLLGIVTLGLVTGVKIIGYLLVGGSMVTGLAADQSAMGQITTLLGMAVVAVLFVLLAMGLLYSVPLTVLRDRPPLEAIAQSFSTCRENGAALLGLGLPFFLVYLVIAVAHAKAHWLGYLLLMSAGFLALPVFIAAVYCSFLALFPPRLPGAVP